MGIEFTYNDGRYGNASYKIVVEVGDLEDAIDSAIEELKQVRRKQKLTKVNKLAKKFYGDRLNDMTDDVLEDIIKNNRASGKSTARVFEILAKAMQNPNCPVSIVDCHPDRHCDNRFLADVLAAVIEKLELDFFVFRKGVGQPPTVTFEI